MKLIHVVGARPNFMKVAPVIQAIEAYPAIQQALIHTGQHYDDNMSDVFFRQLGLPRPDENLGVGSDTHARQTSQIMTSFETVLQERQSDMVLVYGDINSTVAATMVCVKLGVRVGHVEAGLRSFDRTMPEEINRLITDSIADVLYTPSVDGNENLAREGVDPQRVHFVGNVMIDTLVRLLPQAEQGWPELSIKLELVEPYGLVTLHRPSNVDDEATLRQLMDMLVEISASLPLLFPAHPRTRPKLAAMGWNAGHSSLQFSQPLGYLEFLALQKHAKLIITDSGGIQEESTYLGVPCLTMRENTERPVTVTHGTNTLIGQDTQRLRQEVRRVLDGAGKKGQVPPLWDGRAGERIAALVAQGL